MMHTLHPIKSCGKAVAFAFALIAGIHATNAAALLNNGDFELGNLSSWSIDSQSGVTSVTLSSSAQSPFSTGSYGTVLTSNAYVASGGTPARINQNIASASSYGSNTALNLSFDFMYDGTYTGSDPILIARFFDNNNNNAYIAFKAATTPFLTIATTDLTSATWLKNAWYHVSIDLPSISDTNAGTALAYVTLTTTSNISTTYSASWKFAGTTGTYYNRLTLASCFGPQAGTETFIDNIVLTAVPETSTIVMLVIGGIVLSSVALRKYRLSRASC